MRLNNDLTARQIKAYEKTLTVIHSRFGSYHTIALRIYTNCGREVTGETVRAWFAERRVPTHIAFVLYEICDHEIDPLSLCPWLAEHVELRKEAAREG
jgi:hypothetical protein